MADQRDVGDLLYDSARTRVTRTGHLIEKRPLGADAAGRLRNEREMLRRLDGVPGVPQLAPDQQPGLLILRDVHGTVLSDLPQPWQTGPLLDLASALAHVLAAIHRHGIVHRDVSPGNVLIVADGGPPTLIDFEMSGAPGGQHDTLAGTLPYLAPEQTGRTGRPVDHRADLYALGATLYELATGAPPFGRDRDPLHLVHDHLAREPAPPPTPLAPIILKLLSKDPEARYQSGEGLAYDLDRLRAGVLTGLGERDFPMRLAPPAGLVGRDEPMAVLTAMAGNRGRGMVLVTGPPGVGKTALISRLRAETGCRFAAGKFDQYRRDLDADAVRQAFCGIGAQLLAEPEEHLARLRPELLDALGTNAGLAAAVLPPFAALLGVTPEEADDPWRVVNRIQRMGRDLLRTVASADQPLIIFIDDLQWAGPTAFAFLDDVIDNADLSGVFVIGAYREAEVDETHPLNALRTRLRRAGGNTAELHLANLPPHELTELLAGMLRISPADAAPLATVLATRTAGNPFDTVELLNALRRDGALVPEGERWAWDPDTLRRFVGRGDVVDLLGARIEALPPATRELVEAMACLGGEVSLDLLRAATGRDAATVAAGLLPAAEDGLVGVSRDGTPASSFRHDRVQQAAYGRLGPDGRAELALRMARRLVAEDVHRLAAAQQYRTAVGLITDHGEKLAVAALLREAAAAARSYVNQTAAEALLDGARRLLGPGDPGFLATRAEWHSALCGVGRFTDADTVFAELRASGADPVASAGVVAAQMISLVRRGMLPAAHEMGLKQLAEMGVEVPAAEDLARSIGAGTVSLHRWLDQGPDDPDRAPLTDPRLLAVAHVVSQLFPAAFFVDRLVMAWLVMLAFDIWMRHGPAAELVGVGGSVGVIMANRGDYRAGYEATRRILVVGAAHGWEPDTSQARFQYAYACVAWFEPLANAVRAAHDARDGLLRGGDPFHAANTYYASVPVLLDIGDLETYAAEAEDAIALCERTGFTFGAPNFVVHRRFAQSMRGEEPDPADDARMLVASTGTGPVAANFEIMRALTAAVDHDDEALARSSAAALEALPALRGSYAEAQAHLLAVLGAAVRARAATTEDARAAALEQARLSRDHLAARADDQAGNYRHLHRFAAAVCAGADGDFATAARSFDAALADAAAVERSWQPALIAEYAGRFHLGHGMEHAGHRLLTDAWHAYRDWGAHRKVQELAREHPFLAGQPEDRPGATTSVNLSTDAIDLFGVLEAARALSSETDLDRLRATVVDVLGAMTGATAVRLLLRDAGSGEWTPPLAESAHLLPVTAVRYAERTCEPMLVDDVARDDRVARDPYLAGASHCSLLVVPVLHQGVPRGIVILENRLARRAFTTARLNAVMMLAGQLTVSLDNAQLYASLERKVAERTEELAQANHRLELLTITDPLTELPNRRHLGDVLGHEWLRAVRPRTPVGLAMIDIDSFKKYNDHYGHQGGDRCLILVARTLRDNVRETDMVARYGGEEFCIVMPGADEENALAVAERVRQAVAALGEPHPEAGLGFVTISAGVASAVPRPGALPDQLIKIADDALYEAKRAGRNRVAGIAPGNSGA
ncbi:diguanylate cyclase domain-containing protein [Actinoplanes derwentensis]|uniref:diguanylate cyclase domain-containing protein n=1 Tax=Actinoplanes derwentensis TaxID=113562 RepID=UPI0012FE4629|nr:diguanylate cyclase [Actinoplanes derwentensis]